MSEFAQEDFQSFGPRTASGLLGHEAGERSLLAAWDSGRLPHAWLIAGPKGIGKATLAFRFARFVLAKDEAGTDPASLAIAGDSPGFQRVAGFGHPGLLTIERGWDEKRGRWRGEIRVDDVRRLPKFFSMKPEPGQWRVCVIDAADEMNRNAANAALKIIEEPPERGLILLVASAPGRLLPTIRSRCRTLVLQPLSETDVAQILADKRPEIAEADRRAAARLAEGSAGRAIALADAGGAGLYSEMVGLIADLPGLDIGRLNAYIDRLARPTAEPAYRAACDLLRRWLGALVKAGAQAPGPDAVPGEGEGLGRLASRLGVDRRLDLWDKVCRLLDRADSANLDRRQILLSAFLAIETAARG
ncbi:MAG: DNA polymerase III subunit delta' [Alphaproteobacteria bacterium]